MNRVYGNILDTVGNTPLVEVRKLNRNPKVKIYAKLESFNPGGSIKDRTALYMIERAEERGELNKDKIILEATSGNTGIGLAMVAAAKGYRLMLAMSESASEERKKILKAMGARLFFTPANLSTDGAIEFVYETLRENPSHYFVPDQFNNEDNILAHYHGTGPEIWQQTEGKVTMVVATLGTSGTAMGISRRLKEYDAAIRIIGVEPYLGHKIQGLKNMKESYRPGIFDTAQLDERVHIHDDDAFEAARRLAREEGLFVGMSSGAAMHVALEKALTMDEGCIVVICPDSGERYLSTDLFVDKQETSILLYNQLTRKKEPFRPIRADHISVHSCGPTVHQVPHIGVYRRSVLTDILVRYLKFKGYTVKHVSNIIDLADRSIQGALEESVDLKQFTARHIAAFLQDILKLRISAENLYPRASENVETMIELTEKLVEKSYAYDKLRSVYFDVSKLDDYGLLSNVDLTKVREGGTVEHDSYAKDSSADFALLKRSSLAELKKGIYFKTKWGNVRPSWHLECAAMALHYLGDTFDIYSSGSDIIFPHCENVMAIGKAATGKRIANYWLHTDLVMLAGKKMSRTLQNYFTLADLEQKGYSGKEIRYFLLSSHYRKPLRFCFGALDTAKHTLKRLDNFIQRLGHFQPQSEQKTAVIDQLIYDVKQNFSEAMDDDLNISGALAALFTFVKNINGFLGQNRLSGKERDEVLEVLKKLDSVFDIMDFKESVLEKDVLEIIARREEARRNGRWEEADALRNRLAGMGIALQDTPDGPLWRRE